MCCQLCGIHSHTIEGKIQRRSNSRLYRSNGLCWLFWLWSDWFFLRFYSWFWNNNRVRRHWYLFYLWHNYRLRRFITLNATKYLKLFPYAIKEIGIVIQYAFSEILIAIQESFSVCFIVAVYVLCVGNRCSK